MIILILINDINNNDNVCVLIVIMCNINEN